MQRLTKVVVKPPQSTVPPVIAGVDPALRSTPWPTRNMQISKLATSMAPVFFRIAAHRRYGRCGRG